MPSHFENVGYLTTVVVKYKIAIYYTMMALCFITERIKLLHYIKDAITKKNMMRYGMLHT